MIEYGSKIIYFAVFNGVTYYRNEDGYYRTNKKYHTPFLHLAVWEHFGNKIIKGYDIHHKDFDKDNNDIGNLEQLTHSEHAHVHIQTNDTVEQVCKTCGESFITGNLKLNGPIEQCGSCSVTRDKDRKRRWAKNNRERLNKESLAKYHSVEYQETRICLICGSAFSTYKHGPQKLCSRSCAAKSKYTLNKS